MLYTKSRLVAGADLRDLAPPLTFSDHRVWVPPRSSAAAGQGIHDQIEVSVSHDGEFGIHDRRKVTAINKKIPIRK
jgi:hypothetical protein